MQSVKDVRGKHLSRLASAICGLKSVKPGN